MLRPLYTRKATNILLVGTPSSGKRTLARQLLQSPEVFFSTYTLEEITTSELESIKCGLCIITGGLNQSPYIVFTKVDQKHLWMINDDQIYDIIQQFGNITTFYANLSNQVIRKKVVEQIIKLICINTSQQRNIHPLISQFLSHQLPHIK
ncbi:unnamed protein product [Cunninghamella blakesleeana]